MSDAAVIMIFVKPSSRHVILHLMMIIVMTTMTMLLSDGQTIQLTFQYDLLPLASKIIRCKLTKSISRKFQQDWVHKPCMQRETLPGVVLIFLKFCTQFEMVMAGTVKCTWDVMPCSWVNAYQSFWRNSASVCSMNEWLLYATVFPRLRNVFDYQI